MFIKNIIACLLVLKASFCLSQIPLQMDSVKICHQDGLLKQIRVDGAILGFQGQQLNTFYFKDSLFYVNLKEKKAYFRSAVSTPFLELSLNREGKVALCGDTCMIFNIAKEGPGQGSKGFGMGYNKMDSFLLACDYLDERLDCFSLLNMDFGTFNMFLDKKGNRISEIRFSSFSKEGPEDKFRYRIKIFFDAMSGEISEVSICEFYLEDAVQLISKEYKRKNIRLNLLRQKTLAMVDSRPGLYKYRNLIEYKKNGKVANSALPINNCSE